MVARIRQRVPTPRASSATLSVGPGLSYGSMESPALSFVEESVQTIKCPQCNSGEKVVPIAYGRPVEVVEAVQSMDCAVGGCAIFLSLPNLYCKGCEYEWRKRGPEPREEQEA